MSKAEDKIAALLKSNPKIKYLREYTNPTLKHNGHLLRFDFAIVNNYNDALPKILIEYDGEQHFYQVKHFQKTTSKFKQAQERDRIKNSWALRNNIKLIRIPYWELENLTYEKIFNTEKYIVKTKWFNDYLTPPN